VQKTLAAPGAMTRRRFFDDVVGQLRPDLAAELGGFRYSANSWLLKVYFGNERIHYEVWPDSQRGHVEVGLHFEDGPASTAAYLAYFDARIVEIKHSLGTRVELERWTVSWGHLFETVPLVPLDRPFARQIAGLLAAQISLLQPMIEEAAIPAERREQRSDWRERGFRQRSRRG
jgi:hypothetical protein